MDVINVSNGQNCITCCKKDVCKYSHDVIEEVVKLKMQVEKVELPLSININCKQFQEDVPTRKGGFL